jgi:hypothetical protein
LKPDITPKKRTSGALFREGEAAETLRWLNAANFFMGNRRLMLMLPCLRCQ